MSRAGRLSQASRDASAVGDQPRWPNHRPRQGHLPRGLGQSGESWYRLAARTQVQRTAATRGVALAGKGVTANARFTHAHVRDTLTEAGGDYIE
jgi:hypothetical protein